MNGTYFICTDEASGHFSHATADKTVQLDVHFFHMTMLEIFPHLGTQSIPLHVTTSTHTVHAATFFWSPIST